MSILSPAALAEMTNLADEAIGLAMLSGAPGMTGVPRTEVSLVAAFVLGGVQTIAQAWTPIMQREGWRLTLDGVFSHSQPQVRFKPPGSKDLSRCELADLLVVIDRKSATGRWHRRAALIQAKMAAKAGLVVLGGSSSLTQLSLYRSWPDFQFTSSSYGTHTFNLRSYKTPGFGTFGILDRHLKHSHSRLPTWTQSKARPTPSNVSRDPSLGDFLAVMTGGRQSWHGHPSPPSGLDDWSHLIRLLLNRTYAKTFRDKPTLGSARARRGQTAVAFLAGLGQEAIAREFVSRGDFIDVEIIEDPEPGTISVLRMVVEEG